MVTARPPSLRQRPAGRYASSSQNNGGQWMTLLFERSIASIYEKFIIESFIYLISDLVIAKAGMHLSDQTARPIKRSTSRASTHRPSEYADQSGQQID
jgi:hypothetical protein